MQIQSDFPAFYALSLALLGVFGPLGRNHKRSVMNRFVVMTMD